MTDINDNPASLYKEIRLSDIARKFQFPFEFPHPTSPSSLQPPAFLLPQSQQLTNCHHEIEYLRNEIVKLSCRQMEFSAYKADYLTLSSKYQQMLNENIRIHSLIQGGERLENELTEANDKISSLMRENECFHKLKSLSQKETLRLKSQLQAQERKGFMLQGELQILLTEKVQLQQMVDEQRREKQLLLAKYDKEIQEVKSRMEQNQLKFREDRYSIEALQGLKFNLESDIKELRAANKNINQLLREKNDEILRISIGIAKYDKQQEQVLSLQKEIEVKDGLFQEFRARVEKENQQLTSNFSLKFNTIVRQNQELHKSLVAIQGIHNNSLATIQNLQSQISCLQNNSSKLEMENTKLSSALFTSRAESSENRRKTTELSRITCDTQFYKVENERLKQELLLINKKYQEMGNNYSTLMNHLKDRDMNDRDMKERDAIDREIKDECQQQRIINKPRESNESRKSTRSSKSKEPRHAEITLLSSARTRSSNKSHTELRELSNINQYQTVIESKLIRGSFNKTQTLNQNLLKKYKVFSNHK